MKKISRERGKTLSELVSEIDDKRQQGNLSSAICLFVFVLDHFTASRANPNDNQS
jgi:predicted DNA-binding ribbon-helix-helix protein